MGGHIHNMTIVSKLLSANDLKQAIINLLDSNESPPYNDKIQEVMQYLICYKHNVESNNKYMIHRHHITKLSIEKYW